MSGGGSLNDVFVCGGSEHLGKPVMTSDSGGKETPLTASAACALSMSVSYSVIDRMKAYEVMVCRELR